MFDSGEIWLDLLTFQSFECAHVTCFSHFGWPARSCSCPHRWKRPSEALVYIVYVVVTRPASTLGSTQVDILLPIPQLKLQLLGNSQMPLHILLSLDIFPWLSVLAPDLQKQSRASFLCSLFSPAYVVRWRLHINPNCIVSIFTFPLIFCDQVFYPFHCIMQ